MCVCVCECVCVSVRVCACVSVFVYVCVCVRPLSLSPSAEPVHSFQCDCFFPLSFLFFAGIISVFSARQGCVCVCVCLVGGARWPRHINNNAVLYCLVVTIC